MSQELHTHALTGCAPTPLAHYLKALGILRLVSQQADPTAQGWWAGDVFYLRTKLDLAQLVQFFLLQYRPTPIVVPWSGADFFQVDRGATSDQYKSRYPTRAPAKSRPSGAQIVESLLTTCSDRLQPYRTIVQSVFAAMDKLSLDKKSSIEGSTGRANKSALLKELRSSLSDDLVDWCDATNQISNSDEPAFNRLLGGGGGSDGNSHFSDTFMQCLWMVLHDFDGQRNAPVQSLVKPFCSDMALSHSLIGGVEDGALIADLSPGLFNSQAVGGINSSNKGSAKPASNPWDYVFMLEGAILFAGSLSKRTGLFASPESAFPFLVRLSAFGGGSPISDESSNREVWLPVWSMPVQLAEVSHVFSEARFSLGAKYATTGLDAVRAIASLGCDKGITAFERVGLVKGRIGGDNYHTAISMGRFETKRVNDTEIVNDLDPWFNAFRRAAMSDLAPGRVSLSYRILENAIAEFCRNTDKANGQSLVIALGKASAALTLSKTWRERDVPYLKPIPPLTSQWLRACDDGSVDYRLARSVASLRDTRPGVIRRLIEPVILLNGRSEWDDENYKRTKINWRSASVERCLISMFEEILRDDESNVHQKSGRSLFPCVSDFHASMNDIGEYLDQQNSDEKLGDLIRGLCLVRFDESAISTTPKTIQPADERRFSNASFSLLRLCNSPYPIHETYVEFNPLITRISGSGRIAEATRIASRHLKMRGLIPSVTCVGNSCVSARRLTSAMLFPISWSETGDLAKQVLVSSDRC